MTRKMMTAPMSDLTQSQRLGAPEPPRPPRAAATTVLELVLPGLLRFFVATAMGDEERGMRSPPNSASGARENKARDAPRGRPTWYAPPADDVSPLACYLMC